MPKENSKQHTASPHSRHSQYLLHLHHQQLITTSVSEKLVKIPCIRKNNSKIYGNTSTLIDTLLLFDIPLKNSKSINPSGGKVYFSWVQEMENRRWWRWGTNHDQNMSTFSQINNSTKVLNLMFTSQLLQSWGFGCSWYNMMERVISLCFYDVELHLFLCSLVMMVMLLFWKKVLIKMISFRALHSR